MKAGDILAAASTVPDGSKAQDHLLNLSPTQIIAALSNKFLGVRLTQPRIKATLKPVRLHVKLRPIRLKVVLKC